ncbi:MAG: ABC transporter ATP-binding protein [Planctomycetes bacterium]|nr:ABC transporter ATP-binding protein [Planctomycetota bacterium]
MESNTNIVDVRGLRKVYSETETHVVALDSVSLTVHSGEFVAIVGASGSGKSTLLHLLGALDTPTSGVYELNGKNVATMNDDELSVVRRTDIGFVFQVFNLIGQLTVLDNVSLPLRYAGIKDCDAEGRALESLACVGLSHRATHLPSQLSGGEKQRVAIARALVIEPSLVLADEPTGNLDSQTGCTILELFETLHRDGHTIVVVTHDENVAKRADRVITISDGNIVRSEVNA